MLGQRKHGDYLHRFGGRGEEEIEQMSEINRSRGTNCEDVRVQIFVTSLLLPDLREHGEVHFAIGNVRADIVPQLSINFLTIRLGGVEGKGRFRSREVL